MKYRVFTALKEDINSGWIWIENPIIKERTVIKITNLDTGDNDTHLFCDRCNGVSS